MDCLILKCRVCGGNYGEDRVPRNLSCGHVLCTTCMNQRLTRIRSCPECLEYQTVNSASELPINYPLLRTLKSGIIENINSLEKELQRRPADFTLSGADVDAGQCRGHEKPFLFLCIKCYVWACLDCSVIEHRCPPRGSCTLISISEAKKQMKKECERIKNTCQEHLQSFKTNIESELGSHKSCLELCSSNQENQDHVRIVQLLNKNLEAIQRNDDEQVRKTTEILNTLSEKVNESTSTKDLTHFCNTLHTFFTDFKLHMSKEEEGERKADLMMNIVIHWKLHLKELIEKTPVFCMEENEGKRRWAKLLPGTSDGYRICSLKEDTPPEGSIILPFQFVGGLVNPGKAAVFFDIECAKEFVKGRVYIDLFGDTPRGRQTIYLCTGERGPCYRGTCFTLSDEEQGYLEGGDYENNDGTGGHPIIDGTHAFNFNYHQHVQAGIFVSANEDVCNARFGFSLRHRRCCTSSAIGVVFEGLDVLRRVSKIKPIRSVVISECGVCISGLQELQDLQGTL